MEFSTDFNHFFWVVQEMNTLCASSLQTLNPHLWWGSATFLCNLELGSIFPLLQYFTIVIPLSTCSSMLCTMEQAYRASSKWVQTTTGLLNYLSLNSSTRNLAAQQATYQFTYPSKGPYTEKSTSLIKIIHKIILTLGLIVHSHSPFQG
jgi:hypothetical protein